MARRVSRDNATLQFLPWLLVVALCGSLFATINFKKNENQVSSYSEFGSDPESIKAGLQSRLDAWMKSVEAAGEKVEPFLQSLQVPCSSTEKKNEVGGSTEPNEELRSHLSKVASDNEFMFVLANGVMICHNTTICWWNGGNILKSWLDVVTHKLKMTNFIVGVLDDETWKYMDSHYPNVHKFRPKMQIPTAQAGSHPANMVSTLKYGMLRQILELGYNVLVADLDLVFLDNPFKSLYRDSDIEAQTDGFTAAWSYGTLDGIQDKTMGWGGGGLFSKTFTLNVGLMYARSTTRTIDLMGRVEQRLMKAKGWDQQVFNEEVFFVSHGEVSRAQVSVRVMDFLKFANSKTFFRSERARFLPGASAQPDSKPVMVHMNYHPDKHRRMLCIIDRYYNAKVNACDDMPGGSEPGT